MFPLTYPAHTHTKIVFLIIFHSKDEEYPIELRMKSEYLLLLWFTQLLADRIINCKVHGVISRKDGKVQRAKLS